MWVEPIPATQTASDDYSQKTIITGGEMELTGILSTAGTASLHPEIDHLLIWNGGSLAVSGVTLVAKEPLQEPNVIKLSNLSDVQSIIKNISEKPQTGTKLLQLSGVFKGEPDMSSNKKKYLDE